MSLKTYKKRVEKAVVTPWDAARAGGLLQFKFGHRDPEILQDDIKGPRLIQDMIDALRAEFGLNVDDDVVEKAITLYINQSLVPFSTHESKSCGEVN